MINYSVNQRSRHYSDMFRDSAAPTHRRSRSTPRSSIVLTRNRVIGLLALAALAFISCILCTGDEGNPSRRRLRNDFPIGTLVIETSGENPSVGKITDPGGWIDNPTWVVIDPLTGDEKSRRKPIKTVSSGNLKRWDGYKELFAEIKSLRLQLAREMNAETRSFTFRGAVLKHETTFNRNSPSSKLRLWVECIKEQCGGTPQALLYHPARKTIWYGTYHPLTELDDKAYFAITHRFTGSFNECHASDGPSGAQWEELKYHTPNNDKGIMEKTRIAPKGTPPGCDWQNTYSLQLNLPEVPPRTLS